MKEEKKEEQQSEQPQCQNCADYLNNWKRAVADLENHKKKETERMLQANSYSRRSIFKELLPILDSLDRAINAQADEESNEGLEMVKNQFLKILENNGITEIKASIGDEFDHNIHSAITEVDVEDKKLVGKIVEVASAGYQLDEKVIRAVKVIVGK